uniref:Uncharacterized protein n=1 Tax=mine drainage metagenome TaxID=410659 RepID=E6QKF6_9ZZZZ
MRKDEGTLISAFLANNGVVAVAEQFLSRCQGVGAGRKRADLHMQQVVRSQVGERNRIAQFMQRAEENLGVSGVRDSGYLNHNWSRNWGLDRSLRRG